MQNKSDDITSSPFQQGAERQAFVARLQFVPDHWPSADRLAKAAGVSPSALRKWLRGEAEPSRERLVAVARTAGVGVAWLAEGEGPEPVFRAARDEPRSVTGRRTTTREAGSRAGARREVADAMAGDQFVLLPARPEAAAAGAVTPPAPFGDGFMALRHDWVRSVCGVEPHQLALETAIGHSMTPTIGDGDTLLIDTTDLTFNSYGIYVLEIAGQRLVKRVQRKFDGSVVLISDNSAYQADTLDAEAAGELTIVGRVVWVGGRI